MFQQDPGRAEPHPGSCWHWKRRVEVWDHQQAQTPVWECDREEKCHFWGYKPRNTWDKEEGTPPAVSSCDFGGSRKMLSSSVGEDGEKGFVKWLEGTSTLWRPEETLCIIQQRVWITLMDRNTNTVKKLSSVQQIKAINLSGEKPKVEELRLDINPPQQGEQLTTHNSTLRNMELSVSLEVSTWFFLS